MLFMITGGPGGGPRGTSREEVLDLEQGGPRGQEDLERALLESRLHSDSPAARQARFERVMAELLRDFAEHQQQGGGGGGGGPPTRRAAGRRGGPRPSGRRPHQHRTIDFSRDLNMIQPRTNQRRGTNPNRPPAEDRLLTMLHAIHVNKNTRRRKAVYLVLALLDLLLSIPLMGIILRDGVPIEVRLVLLAALHVETTHCVQLLFWAAHTFFTLPPGTLSNFEASLQNSTIVQVCLVGTVPQVLVSFFWSGHAATRVDARALWSLGSGFLLLEVIQAAVVLDTGNLKMKHFFTGFVLACYTFLNAAISVIPIFAGIVAFEAGGGVSPYARVSLVINVLLMLGMWSDQFRTKLNFMRVDGHGRVRVDVAAARAQGDMSAGVCLLLALAVYDLVFCEVFLKNGCEGVFDARECLGCRRYLNIAYYSAVGQLVLSCCLGCVAGCEAVKRQTAVAAVSERNTSTPGL